MTVMRGVSPKVKVLLFEAYRRNAMSNPLEARKPLLKRWLGLGTEAGYRPILKAGLMRFHDDQAPPPRCMEWLCLTPAGIAAMERHTTEFAQALQALRSDPHYQSSYAANYMMAGGVVGG